MNNMDWIISDNLIVKEFEFLNLKQATKFADEISRIAIQEEHYPKIEQFEGKKVRVSITPINGTILTNLDIRLANLINSIG